MEEQSAFSAYKKAGINKSSNKQISKKIQSRKQEYAKNTSKKSKANYNNKKKNGKIIKLAKTYGVDHLQEVTKESGLYSGNDIQKQYYKKTIEKNSAKEAMEMASPSKTNIDKAENATIIGQQVPSPNNVPPRNDSIKDGKNLFKWLMSPVNVEVFFEKFWEKAPCLIERNNPNFFSKLISFSKIDQILIDNHIEFTKNIDVTSYKNGVRETLNPEGRAIPPVVWDHYSNGCSIRLLNPQTFIPPIFALNTSLQELFHCMVGSNAYLTPPNSQGFAPHYDDIEAFVLQIEGRKRWKLYNPRNVNEQLPRYSSENFAQADIGKPILEKVLMPGDILYFPRGTIHQAFTEPGYHSLHITLSVYQKQSYADLFEKLFPMILQRAISENVDFRRGLPLNVWHNAGIVYSDNKTQERKEFLRKCRDLIAKSLEEMPLDQAIDQLAKKFQHEALPPNITGAERSRTVFGSKNIVDSEGMCQSDYNITSSTKVRLLRANIMRLIEEDDAIRIYYYVDNSKEYCEYEPNYIEIESEFATSVEVLIKSYPEYIAVNELPLEDDEEKKISIVTALWERGLLMFEKPICC